MGPIVPAAASVLLSMAVLNAAVTKAQAGRLHQAAVALQEIHKAPDRDIPNDLWAKAECIAVFPSVKKAAFIFGGEYGKGVMACRHGSNWSAPAFMTLQKGSIGFQIGGETVDLVLLVMNDHGMHRLLKDKVALGGEASVAGGPVGRDARAMTDAQLKAEILSYSRSQGVFAGLDVSGGVIRPDGDDNRDLYGADVSPENILLTNSVSTPPEAGEFIEALRRHVPAGE
jgi:SH3 domain-containing YSC84-like protein 1